MSLENLEVIDVVSIDLNGKVVLTIADHLEWNESKHLFLLQSKIDRYLDALANGSLYASYPDAEGRSVVINIAAKYSPDAEGQSFFSQQCLPERNDECEREVERGRCVLRRKKLPCSNRHKKNRPFLAACFFIIN